MTTQKRVLAVIMGGGRGTRLHPLTLERCKPAVPLAGKYRLVDIPISNCLNSDINRMFLLTQFQTASLHRHEWTGGFGNPATRAERLELGGQLLGEQADRLVVRHVVEDVLRRPGVVLGHRPDPAAKDRASYEFH